MTEKRHGAREKITKTGKPYWVYIIMDSGQYAKVGVSHNVGRRLKILQTGNPQKLRVYALLRCENRQAAYELESAIHKIFKKHGSHTHGEWFKWSLAGPVYKKYLSVFFRVESAKHGSKTHELGKDFYSSLRSWQREFHTEGAEDIGHLMTKSRADCDSKTQRLTSHQGRE